MKLINEKFNIWGCVPQELSYKQLRMVSHSLKTDTPETFLSFFDPDTRKILVNLLSGEERIKKFVARMIDFLSAASETNFYDEWITADMTEEEENEVLSNIEYFETLKAQKKAYDFYEIYKHSKIDLSELDIIRELRNISVSENKKREGFESIELHIIYYYGLIQGIRQERAKSKKPLG